MCTLVHRKYDCTKCQRRIRDDKWIEHCERVREGSVGSCEPEIEYETSYVPAEECEVCEMYRMMEAEEAAEKEKKDKEGCSAI
ncbi:hypothetical protein ACJ41O_013481 [Fusarium nematophilum]